jgi:hypothetical protein
MRGSCDHDGRASGRLVLEAGGLRSEIVCDCGAVLAVLAHEGYEVLAPAQPDAQAAPAVLHNA